MLRGRSFDGRCIVSVVEERLRALSSAQEALPGKSIYARQGDEESNRDGEKSILHNESDTGRRA